MLKTNTYCFVSIKKKNISLKKNWKNLIQVVFASVFAQSSAVPCFSWSLSSKALYPIWQGCVSKDYKIKSQLPTKFFLESRKVGSDLGFLAIYIISLFYREEEKTADPTHSKKYLPSSGSPEVAAVIWSSRTSP